MGESWSTPADADKVPDEDGSLARRAAAAGFPDDQSTNLEATGVETELDWCAAPDSDPPGRRHS
jgi:hypothetical protein